MDSPPPHPYTLSLISLLSLEAICGTWLHSRINLERLKTPMLGEQIQLVSSGIFVFSFPRWF